MTDIPSQPEPVSLAEPVRKQRWYGSPLLLTVIALCTVGINVWQVGVARDAANAARVSAEVAASTSKLDLEPELRIHNYMGKKRTTYIALFNAGPVPATHVTVQLFKLGYDPKKKAVSVGISQALPDFYFAAIQPKRSVDMPLDRTILTERFIMSFADAKMEEPYYNDILEVRVRYYRDVDNKPFGGRKFFFRTLEGEWARENQSSFPREILAAALKMPSREIPPFRKLNPLNECQCSL